MGLTAAVALARSVVVEGYLYFNPSGQPLRVEADYIAAAQPGDELWARVPRAEATHRQCVRGEDLLVRFVARAIAVARTSTPRRTGRACECRFRGGPLCTSCAIG